MLQEKFSTVFKRYFAGKPCRRVLLPDLVMGTLNVCCISLMPPRFDLAQSWLLLMK